MATSVFFSDTDRCSNGRLAVVEILLSYLHVRSCLEAGQASPPDGCLLSTPGAQIEHIDAGFDYFIQVPTQDYFYWE